MAKKAINKKAANLRAQTFSFLAPEATSVQLVGEFTRWQEQPVAMQKSADGRWRATVNLEPGTHYYRFIVDGKWRDDPDCTLRAPNAFGSQNMMRPVA